ncbi:inhibitor of Brome mosaic virus [Geranomyces variabilis]|uniref:Inhibitor of Brome mosaic virus n=1 Tax=Geranomyces variabilis TaxID=109894 RepID=A0AAD5XQ48_9FUNG|nr:inhibitor of Brome mosaic virus [Geranomyces variabilis]
MSEAKPKQPKGLKRSLAKPAPKSAAAENGGSSKRQKPNPAGAQQGLSEPKLPPDVEAGTKTVALDVEEQDEVSVLKALFDSAVEKHESGDLEGAKDLFRGCVHECDKVLRIHSGAVPQAADANAVEDAGIAASGAAPMSSSDATPLPPDFHLVYGNALFQLGLTTMEGATQKEEDTLDAYFDAAVERLEVGLERAEAEKADDFRIRAALGRVLLEKSSWILESSGDIPSADALSERALTLVDIPAITALDLSIEKNLALVSDILDVGTACQRHADVRADSAACGRWVDVAQKLYTKILEASPSYTDALIGLGGASLSLANHLVEEWEAEDVQPEDSDALPSIRAHLDTALDYFERAQKAAGETLDTLAYAPLLLLTGECLVNLGNYSESDAEPHQRAIEYFRRVQKIDSKALPAEFAEFIQEWEEQMA